MRKLVVGTFLTLDGVMQAPGGPEEDRDGGFEHGGWSVKYWDEMMGRLIVEQVLRLRPRGYPRVDTGVAIHHYARAGKLEYGSFEVDVAGSSSELWSGGDRAG
jgi:hypothetical protein